MVCSLQLFILILICISFLKPRICVAKSKGHLRELNSRLRVQFDKNAEQCSKLITVSYVSFPSSEIFNSNLQVLQTRVCPRKCCGCEECEFFVVSFPDTVKQRKSTSTFITPCTCKSRATFSKTSVSSSNIFIGRRLRSSVPSKSGMS